MRLAVLLVMLLVADAGADKKIQDMTPGYERELAGCQTQAGGMLKVANGAAALAKTADAAEKPELEKAAAALAKGHAAFNDYCTELGALTKFLQDSASAAYKSIERELDNRATKVSKLRRDAKKLSEELAPLTRKLIPRITKLPTAAPEPEKRTPAKFPSGRAISLPVLAGSWKLSGTAISDVAEYTDKQVTATVTTRQLDGECNDHKKAIAKDAEQLADLDVKAVWAVRYLRREQSGAHLVEMLCQSRGTGSLLAVVDLRPETAPLADALTRVALDMLAAK